MEQLLLVPVTDKSSAVPASVNALLGPMLRSYTTGVEAGGLNFKTDAEFGADTEHLAPTGYFPEAYDAATPLGELDPTARSAVARRISERLSRTKLIARSSTLAELEAKDEISRIFAEWWKEYCLVAALAIKAERSIVSGARVALDDRRSVYHGDGHIEAFYLATGNLVGTELNMSTTEDPYVVPVFERVVTLLKPFISALNHAAFMEGLEHVKNTIGMGTRPSDGVAVAHMRARTFEKLYRGNLSRAMRHPHVRGLLDEVILSRIPQRAMNSTTDLVINIGEEVLVIPQSFIAASGTPRQLLDLVYDHIDQHMANPLTTADYERDHPEFEDQFRTTGDLVRALFVSHTVDPLVPSNLEVLLSAPNPITLMGVDGFGVGRTPFGTGGLASNSLVDSSLVNVIAGMDQLFNSYNGAMTGVADTGLITTCLLPNGILNMLSPADVSALDWLAFLRWYVETTSDELNYVRERLSLTRMDLKPVKVELTNSAEAYAALNYNSQLNGVSSPAFASFNLDKYARIGQQGPILADLHPAVGPALVASKNEWTRTEGAATFARTGLEGTQFLAPASGHLSSRFVGEPQGHKTPSPLITPRIPTVGQFGKGDITQALAEALISYPLTLDGTQTLSVTSQDTVNRGTFMNDGTSQLTITNINGAADPRTWWNRHPLEGFKRGFVMGRSFEDNAGTFNPSGSTVVDQQFGWVRETVGVVTYSHGGYNFDIARPYGWTGNNIAYVSPQGQDLFDYISTGEDYHLRPYGQMGRNTMWKCVWYWDPNQTCAIGPTNRVLYGEHYAMQTFSAAHEMPVSVAIGAIRTQDLQSKLPSFSESSAVLLTASGDNVSNANPTANEGFSVSTQHDIALLMTSVEQDVHCYPAVMVSNGWFDRMDMVSEQWSADHMVWFTELANGVANERYPDPAAFGELTGLGDISIARRLMSKTNPYQKVNQLAGYGLGATNGMAHGTVVFPMLPTSGPRYFDGPTLCPANDDATTLVLQGVGLTHTAAVDGFQHGVLSWMLRTLIDAPTQGPSYSYPLAEFSEIAEAPIVPGAAQRPFRDAILPAIPQLAVENGGHGNLESTGNLPGPVSTTERWFLMDGGGVNVPYPEWLLQSRDGKYGGFSSPWKRDADGYGYEVQQYTPSDVSAMISTKMRDVLQAEGEAQTAGMTNELFRDLYVTH